MYSPPTALTTASPLAKMPTSYLTLELPSFVTRRPSSSTDENETGPKYSQQEETTNPAVESVHALRGFESAVLDEIGVDDQVRKHDVYCIVYMSIYVVVTPTPCVSRRCLAT